MTAIDAIRLHLDNLSRMKAVVAKPKLTNFVHGLFNNFVEFSIFCMALGAPISMFFILEVGSANPNIKLVEAFGGMGACLVAFWITAFTALKIGTRRANSHAHQWNSIMNEAEAILKYNSGRAGMVGMITNLINDNRVTYQWADTLRDLMKAWRQEEYEHHKRNEQLERLEVLKGETLILAVEGNPNPVIAEPKTPLHISL